MKGGGVGALYDETDTSDKIGHANYQSHEIRICDKSLRLKPRVPNGRQGLRCPHQVSMSASRETRVLYGRTQESTGASQPGGRTSLMQ